MKRKEIMNQFIKVQNINKNNNTDIEIWRKNNIRWIEFYKITKNLIKENKFNHQILCTLITATPYPKNWQQSNVVLYYFYSQNPVEYQTLLDNTLILIHYWIDYDKAHNSTWELNYDQLLVISQHNLNIVSW